MSEFKVCINPFKDPTKRVSIYAEGRYQREYPKGAIVQAAPESIGIFVFAFRKDAENFVRKHGGIIIRVLGIGIPCSPKVISMGQAEADLDRWYSYDYALNTFAPEGTIAFEAVEVLE